MAFFHHELTKKYTLALLSTFNNLETQYKDSNGNLVNSIVPIKFSTREKSTIFDEHETEALLNGKTNILPRLSLSFELMLRNYERSGNKFVKVNKVIPGTNEIFSYTFQPLPYDYEYILTLQARGMSEAQMITEQIAAYFNPNYTLKINEIGIQDEPTSVPIVMTSITHTPEDYEELSMNIVTVEFALTLKGNIYPPIREEEAIKKFRILMDLWNDGDIENSLSFDRNGKHYFKRASAIEFDIDSNTNFPSSINKYDFAPYMGMEKPKVLSIILPNGEDINNIPINSNIKMIANYYDRDNLAHENNTYLWSVLPSSTATVILDTSSNDNSIIVTPTSTGTLEIGFMIIDTQNNSSNLETIILNII